MLSNAQMRDKGHTGVEGSLDLQALSLESLEIEDRSRAQNMVLFATEKGRVFFVVSSFSRTEAVAAVRSWGARYIRVHVTCNLPGTQF